MEPVDGEADESVLDDASLADDANENEVGDEEVASAEQAVYSGFTSFTSEEYQPVVCDPGSGVSGALCSGWYCDNIALHCKPTGWTGGATYWTSYFSEEPKNSGGCAWGYWMSGVACNGWYCDNISLQCTMLYGSYPKNCHWTGWMSEEAGGFLGFPTGYYARGVECNGWYCDNKRYYICQP
jgi:hypothetical protein